MIRRNVVLISMKTRKESIFETVQTLILRKVNESCNQFKGFMWPGKMDIQNVSLSVKKKYKGNTKWFPLKEKLHKRW